LKTAQEEWKEAWGNSSLQKEISQIIFETYYTSSFSNLFTHGEFILEAGCGFGRYCFWLQKSGVSSVGVDIIREALVTGSKYAKSNGLESYFVLADVTNLPFKNGVFDGYISLGVIEHFKSKDHVKCSFSEMHRVLNDRGKAFVSVPNPLALHHLLPNILSFFGYKPKIFLKPLYKKDLIAYAEHEGFRITKIYVCDFYYSFYAILSHLFKANLWFIKHIMKQSLNIFDKIPIFKQLGSGIHLILRNNRTTIGKGESQ